jgi:hypothetical protein
MRYIDIKDKVIQFKSLVGINQELFELLHNSYSTTWFKYIAHYTLKGKIRTRDYRKRIDEIFSTTEDQLLFILHYIKANSLQEHHAAAYGMSQPQANVWIHLLLKLLHQTLQMLQQIPSRNASKIEELLKNINKVYIDATEREIQRPSDYELQQDYYSGKKRCIVSRTPLLVLKKIR